MIQLPPVALIIFSNDLDDYLEHIELKRKFIEIEEALENYNDSNRLFPLVFSMILRTVIL